MKTLVIICKIFCILYSIACVGAEIWYLITLRKIRDYHDHDVELSYFLTIYPAIFYFLGYLLLMIMPFYTEHTWDGLKEYLGRVFCTLLATLVFGFIYYSSNANLGKIPFNCDVDYLPDNVKIACKARFISCTLYFSSFAIPVLPSLGLMLYYLFSEFKKLTLTIRIINSLQRNLFVL